LERGAAILQQSGFFRAVESAVVVLLLLMFSEGLLAQLLATEAEPDGSPFMRMLWMPVYAVILCLCLAQIKPMLQIAVRSPLLVAVSLLAAVSFLWSIDPGLSQRRGIAISCTTIFGVWLAARYEWRDLLKLLAAAWLILAVASVIAGAVFPAFGVMDEIHVGAWKGIWWEKNTLGGHMARASFLFAFLLLMDEQRRKVWAFGLVLATALVLLSTSKTALLGMLLGFGVLAAAAIMRRGRVTSIAAVWIGVSLSASLAMALVLAPEAMFGIIGKDPSLTGRTDIWAALIDAIEKRPWLGHGYGAFWPIESEPAYWVREAVEWDAPTAHNGWFETALSIGVIGAGLFVMSFALSTGRAVLRMLSSWTGVFAVGFIAQYLLFSLSESIILQQNAIVWVMYVAVAARLALEASKDAGRQRLAKRPKSRIGDRRPVKISSAAG